jgi:hypothetical protein
MFALRLLHRDRASIASRFPVRCFLTAGSGEVNMQQPQSHRSLNFESPAAVKVLHFRKMDAKYTWNASILRQRTALKFSTNLRTFPTNRRTFTMHLICPYLPLHPMLRGYFVRPSHSTPHAHRKSICGGTLVAMCESRTFCAHAAREGRGSHRSDFSINDRENFFIDTAGE